LSIFPITYQLIYENVCEQQFTNSEAGVNIILGVTFLFIICHLSRSAIDYLLYYTQQQTHDQIQKDYITLYRLASQAKYNSDDHQFHQYPQNEQSPVTITELTEHNTDHDIRRWKSRSWLGTGTKTWRGKTGLWDPNPSLFISGRKSITKDYLHMEYKYVLTNSDSI